MATPIQNRLRDIYSLVDCLAVARGHTNPFGTPEQFASRFIADGKVAARRLKQEHADEFRKIVNSYMFRTRRLDATPGKQSSYSQRSGGSNTLSPERPRCRAQPAALC